MESLAESMSAQAAMPRFEDGSINLRELIRTLAEDVVNAIMDAEADQRLCAGGANSRNGYRERNLVTCVGDITLRIPKLRSGSFFPEDIVEALPARRPRSGGGGCRDVRHGQVSTRKVQRVAGEARHLQIVKGPGQRDSEEPRCRRGRAARARSLGESRTPYLWPRCDIREVPPERKGLLHRGGDRDRLRRGRLAARPRPVGGGHGVRTTLCRLGFLRSIRRTAACAACSS